jgi:hypothetical protein
VRARVRVHVREIRVATQNNALSGEAFLTFYVSKFMNNVST